jgi:hypothetical protein
LASATHRFNNEESRTMPESQTPEYCLARAEQCENFASQSSFELTREKFLQLAKQWRALAAEEVPIGERAAPATN